MIGVWQWWSRDVASHISQNIFITSYSLKPHPSRSFICCMTQPGKKDRHRRHKREEIHDTFFYVGLPTETLAQ